MPYSRNERDELEILLDKLGVEGIMSALAEICYEKEAHVQEYWQDRSLAARWRKLGAKLEKMAPELDDPHFQ
jgi:hypothetical protein